VKEKLVIKNFGPIKSVELELGRFNVLIGEQGTGKSTVAKLLTGLRSTFFIDLFNVTDDETINRETQLFFEHLKLVEIQNYFYDNTEIQYLCELYSLELKNKMVIIKKRREPLLEESLYNNLNYIPAERILVTTLANSLFALIETGTSLPKLFLRFGDKFQKARKEQTSFDYTNILGIKYIYKDNKDIIILPSGKEIPTQDASSGIQGSVSLLTVFNSITGHGRIKHSHFQNSDKLVGYLIIEEPELSCFPETQHKLLKHISKEIAIKEDFGKVYYKYRLLITTHSPYILTSLNNMMYAYKIGQLYNDEADKIIEKKYWINPDDVSVYMMLPNGECEDIFDREEGMIKAEKIDEVSRKLNSQFDLLQDIELGINEDK